MGTIRNMGIFPYIVYFHQHQCYSISSCWRIHLIFNMRFFSEMDPVYQWRPYALLIHWIYPKVVELKFRCIFRELLEYFLKYVFYIHYVRWCYFHRTRHTHAVNMSAVATKNGIGIVGKMSLMFINLHKMLLFLFHLPTFHMLISAGIVDYRAILLLFFTKCDQNMKPGTLLNNNAAQNAAQPYEETRTNVAFSERKEWSKMPICKELRNSIAKDFLAAARSNHNCRNQCNSSAGWKKT